jgi:N-methylhydantoinase B
MDPVHTAIMNNRFVAIVEEASAKLHCTAHTTFIKLVQDYQCALATVDGDIFAYPRLSGVTHVIGLPLQAVLARFDLAALHPGDVLVTNDPFASDGMVTHLMDITVIAPIFSDGRLIAFGWAFLHASDIGGAVPGSISPHLTEVYQEGLRIRPMKLFNAGVLNTDLRDIFLDNSRIPDEMWGDFQALLASLHSMDQRLRQLCLRYGADAVLQGMADVIDFAELKARSVIARIPDGTYEFADYVEGFAENQFTHIRTVMHVTGDTMHVDFTGTDPQIPAAYNLTTGARTHPYLMQAVVSYILTIEPHAPRNMGLLRPISTNAPRGTILNAILPAAGGSRVASSARTYDTIIGCLHQALPAGLAGGGSGMVGIVVVNAADRMTGLNRVTVINPICGGGGGRAGRDGIDGTDVRFGMLMSVPTELIEVETVILVRAYGLMEDTQAAGRWRGGAAVALELENTGNAAMITARGLNRFHFRPWGVDGGAPGQLCEVIMQPGTPAEHLHGKIAVLNLQQGDVVRITSSAGGGFGDPLKRDPSLILADIAAGLLSPAKARADYGVALESGGAIDQTRTAERRDVAARERGPVRPFAFGHERDAQDRIWPTPVRAALAVAAMTEVPNRRHALLEMVCRQMATRGEPVDSAVLQQALTAGRQTLAGRGAKAATLARQDCA